MATLKAERSVKYQRTTTVSARVEAFGALAYDHASRRLVSLSPQPIGEVLVLLQQPLTVTEITERLNELNLDFDETVVSKVIQSLIAANICFEVAANE